MNKPVFHSSKKSSILRDGGGRLSVRTLATNLAEKLNHCCGVALMLYAAQTAASNTADRREYQHGIEFLPAAQGGYWLVWSSSKGDPPAGEQTRILADGTKCSYFTHDVYSAYIDTQQPEINPQRLVALPEAQEPVSGAVAANGAILLTFEDGSDSNITTDCWGRIQQRFTLYDHELTARTKLQTVSTSGAHSGHVAAVGDRFVIGYSEGWDNRGGDDNFGTGKRIFLDVINTQGGLQRSQAVVNGAHSKDWWPLIAGSSHYALLVWQRYVKQSQRAILMTAIYDPQAGRLLKRPTPLQTEVYYYHYDVQYLSGINRFLVAGNQLGEMVRERTQGNMPLKTQKGFIYLLDEQGDIVARWSASHACEVCGGYHTHPFVREAQPAIYDDAHQVKVLYPVKPKGMLLFAITANSIRLLHYVSDDYYWHSLGTDGIFLNRNTAYFASLSPLGLQTRMVHVE
jgi:hypothetical protein